MSKDKELPEDTFLDDLVKDNEPEPEGYTLVSGAEFWNFERSPVFVGQYIGQHLDNENEVLGYDFKTADGEDWIIGTNFSITQALTNAHPEKPDTQLKDTKPWLWIKFLGKVKVDKGNFNKFKIVLMKEAPKKAKK